jgi:[lysine-biosynthesis-protein LysW]--L-2-aminoadipate ligase
VATVVVGSAANRTNVQLVAAWAARGVAVSLVSAAEAMRALHPGDRALGRIDVPPSLDGVEPGLLALLLLERRGVEVLNGAAALLNAHDKLRTARCLERAGLPHPRTTTFRAGDPVPVLGRPLVLKPRFGSWGRDVLLCRDGAELGRSLAAVGGRPWFRRHGALVQELVPPLGYDLRLVVAAGEVVGGGERVAARGDWRTNISRGGTLRRAVVPADARALAVAAAAAVGADLVGVDLLPVGSGGHVVLELNGAVDFDERYRLDGRDPYEAAARVLGLTSRSRGLDERGARHPLSARR